VTFRSLALIKKSGSTSRILNLHLVHERFGTTEAFNNKPLFYSKSLNRSLIMKHAVRGADHYLFETHKPSVTKVILPFAKDDLGIGGTNIFVGQKNFEGALQDLAGGYKDDSQLQKDAELLIALDKMPALDPFLLREQLRLMSRDPARCYFQISDADLHSMQSFVSEQVNGLIEMAFAGNGPRSSASKEVCAQMAAKILSDENAESLAPLKAALGLDGAEWADGVFCWKGFLYYKWMFGRILSKSAATLEQMQRINFARCDAMSATTAKNMRARTTSMVREKLKAMSGLLNIYDSAYKTMTVEKKPAAFKDFLLKSPAMFLEIGETAGLVSHVSSFWEFKCKNGDIGILEGPELVDVFQEFENCRTAQSGSQANEVVWGKA
jgi:hypothetical protein